MKLKLTKLFNRINSKSDETFKRIMKKLRYIGLTLDLMVIEKRLWREFPDHMYKKRQEINKRIFEEEFKRFQKFQNPNN